MGFGLDSFVESLSGAVMVWRFWNYRPDTDEEEFESFERRAARLVAWSLFLLAAYVIGDASLALYRRESPETSVLGIAIGVASLVVMPVLFVLKYRLGRSIGSRSLMADSKETLARLLLTVALLVGLVAHAVWRLWWIDPAAALVIAVLILREGFETLGESRE
ncbi:MAG: cation transporter [Pirellulales bacterium]